jgi:diaminohydroxyphosphoribosylaminopyrimidine deaminase/5-amino-6-(5-phosphoribosylamino)uracil reductase
MMALMAPGDDAKWMKRCFELARRGAGMVSPNPMVGAVLVHNNRTIGEGWHERWGGPHAEVNCFKSVAPDDERLIPESVLYCNLEPCSHFGKTPPCASLVTEKRVGKVVIANTDPNPLVAGSGIEMIRKAGILVETGLLEEEGYRLNRAFFTKINEKRPYIILKWAQTADGFLGRPGERTSISAPPALRLAHRWRSESDAILVGATTATTDNPLLDTRFYFGKNPLRILLDGAGSVPADSHLLSDNRETLIFGPARPGAPDCKRFTGAHARTSVQEIAARLYLDNIGILYVEGGAGVLQQFADTGYWDEIRILESRQVLGSGIKAPAIPAGSDLFTTFKVGADQVNIFFRQSVHHTDKSDVPVT